MGAVHDTTKGGSARPHKRRQCTTPQKEAVNEFDDDDDGDDDDDDDYGRMCTLEEEGGRGQCDVAKSKRKVNTGREGTLPPSNTRTTPHTPPSPLTFPRQHRPGA